MSDNCTACQGSGLKDYGTAGFDAKDLCNSCNGSGKATASADKPLTKQEMLDQSRANGLVLDGLTKKHTVAEIQAAIDAESSPTV